MEDPRQEVAIAFAGAPLLFLIDRPRRQDVNGGIDIAEGPLVGRNLAVRVHVPLAQHEQELLLGEAGVDQAEGDAMECQIPGRVPGVLPFVRHRDDVAAVVVPPLAIAPMLASLGRRRTRRIAVEPLRDIEVENLLGPDQTSQRLSLDTRLVLGQAGPRASAA